MAVGDDATAGGYTLVPDTGQELAKVRWGAQEINRTRDFIAQVKGLILVSKVQYRAAAGLSSGTAAPSGGADGDQYLQIIG